MPGFFKSMIRNGWLMLVAGLIIGLAIGLPAGGQLFTADAEPAPPANIYSSQIDDDDIYQVIVNFLDIYSIWLEYKELPVGWSWVDFRGTKTECLEYIAQLSG